MYLLSLYHISVFYAIYPTGATTIVQLPLAFVRSGDINLPDGNISGSGYGGYNWSRTVNSSTVAYRLVFNTNGVNTNRDGYYYGFPLRCRFLFLH